MQQRDKILTRIEENGGTVIDAIGVEQVEQGARVALARLGILGPRRR